jgi:plasmid stabilization system protein ParE
MGQFTVRLRKKALDDVSRIRSWYRTIGPSLEVRFLQSLNRGLDRIEVHLLACQAIYRNTRRVLLARFPYSIFYLVVETKVTVLAVVHHKRNPDLAQGISE